MTLRALLLCFLLAACSSAAPPARVATPSPYDACDRNPDRCHGCGDAGAESACPGQFPDSLEPTR